MRLLLAGILLLAILTRLYQLDHYGLWADEVWGLMDCTRGGLQVLIAQLMHSDNHPPGYEILLYFWIKLFGTSDYAVRIPSVITGVAAVAAIYRSGKVHYNTGTGLLAACLLAGSFQAIYYSQEARAYSPLLLACLLNAHTFLNIFLDKSTKKTDLWLFWSSGTAMLYLHYTGSVFLASEALVFLFLWLKAGSKQIFTTGIKAFLPILVLYGPWLPTMYVHANAIEKYWAEKPTIEHFFHLWNFLLGPGAGFHAVQLACLLAAAVLALRDSLLHQADRESSKTATLFALVLLPMAIFFAKSHYTQSIHEERHFIYAIPLISLLVAQYISRMVNHLDNKSSLNTLMAAIIIVIAFEQVRSNQENHLYNLNNKQEIREGAALIAADKAFTNSKGIVISSHMFFLHYLKRDEVKNTYLCCFNDTTPLQEIQDIIGKKQPKTFYFIEIILPNQPMLGILQSQYRLLCSSELNMVRVSKFRTDTTLPARTYIPACPL